MLNRNALPDGRSTAKEPVASVWFTPRVGQPAGGPVYTQASTTGAPLAASTTVAPYRVNPGGTGPLALPAKSHPGQLPAGVGNGVGDAVGVGDGVGVGEAVGVGAGVAVGAWVGV